MRRLLAILLTMALLIGVCLDKTAQTAYATETANETIYTYGDFSYQFNSSNQIIITKYNGSEETVTVPDYIGGYQVIGVGSKAFYKNTGIKKVILSNGITDIGDSAFEECSKLSYVSFN